MQLQNVSEYAVPSFVEALCVSLQSLQLLGIDNVSTRLTEQCINIVICLNQLSGSAQCSLIHPLCLCGQMLNDVLFYGLGSVVMRMRTSVRKLLSFLTS